MANLKTRRACCVCGLMALSAVIAGCSGEDPSAAPPIDSGQPFDSGHPSDVTGDKSVGADAGNVKGPMGSWVQVPPCANSTTLRIEVSQSGYPTLPPAVAPRSTIFGFLPHGQTFSQSVTVHVPFTGAQPSEVELYTAAPGGSW